MIEVVELRFIDRAGLCRPGGKMFDPGLPQLLMYQEGLSIPGEDLILLDEAEPQICRG